MARHRLVAFWKDEAPARKTARHQEFVNHGRLWRFCVSLPFVHFAGQVFSRTRVKTSFPDASLHGDLASMRSRYGLIVEIAILSALWQKALRPGGCRDAGSPYLCQQVQTVRFSA